jgi:hypothetical protein
LEKYVLIWFYRKTENPLKNLVSSFKKERKVMGQGKEERGMGRGDKNEGI